MDKPIWQQIKQEPKSFEEVLVLLLTSKLISIDRRYIMAARAIDLAYEERKLFTVNDWIKLHDIGVSLWYRQYSSSSGSINFEYFSKELLPKYQEILNLLLEKSTQFSQLEDIESLRDESLKIWKDFMAKLAFLSNLEQQSGNKPKKSRFNSDTLFAILVIIALILGMSLAILVSFIRR